MLSMSSSLLCLVQSRLLRCELLSLCIFFFFFQAEDGIRDLTVTGVQTCALPILADACDIKVFSCPKLGNSLEEYEDAWAHRETRTPVGIRVAVADGATERDRKSVV